MILAFTFLAFAFSLNDDEKINTNRQMKESSILIVYFSCTGNTKRIAGNINSIIGGNLVEIIPQNPYTSADLNYNDQSSRVVREHNDQTILPEISGTINNLQQYHTIFLGYPLYWGKAPNIIRTFMKKYDFSGKTIITFCTSASTSTDSSKNILPELAPKAKWDGNTWKRFGSSTGENAVKEWVDSLNFDKEILIVYFSAQGHTKRIAEFIQKTKNADIKAITPVNPYTNDDLNWHNENSRVWEEHRKPDLRPEIENLGSLDKYNIIFLGYPLWWRKAPHVVYTFIEQYSNSLSGRIIIPFCSSTSDPIGDSGTDLQSKASSSKWLSGQRFGENPSEDSVVTWAKSLDFSDVDIDTNPENDKVMVVYFSATGNTRRVAERIYNLLPKRRLVEISPVEPYTSADLNYNSDQSRVSKEHQDQSLRPPINDIENVDAAEIIFLGYPLWWQQAPHVVCTFIEKYKFDNKIIIPFCTSSSSPMGNSGENLAKKASSAKFFQGQRFSSGVNDDTIKEWFDAVVHINSDTGKITVSDNTIDSKGLTKGQIAGIVIGCVVFVAAICILVIFIIRRKKNQTGNNYGNGDQEDSNLEE